MPQTCCFQCGLPVPASESHSLVINDKAQQFCCFGCKTVAQLINENGLVDFYQYRTNNVVAKTADIVDSKNMVDFSFYDNAEMCKEFVTDVGDGKLQAQLYIEGIHCTACTWLIEQFIGRLPQISRINVNSATHTCLLEFEKTAKLSDILKQFVELGYQPKPSVIGQQQILSESENKTALLRLAVAGFAMMQVGMFAIALYAGTLSDMAEQWQSLFRWVSLVVATPVVIFSAQPFFIGARRALVSRHLTMDVPVALAIALAFLASCWATITNTGDVYFDSVSMFTFFLLIGRYLEMRVRHKNEQSINQLVYLLPPYVMRLEESFGNTVRKPIPLNRISVGEYIWGEEGEIIPVDGIIDNKKIVDLSSKNQQKNNNKKGQTFFVNESMLTGEATPIKKNINDAVLAGTINMDSGMIIRVTAVGSQTRLSAIQNLMSDALHQKPRQISRADRLSGYFVGFVLVLSVVVAVIWYFIDPARAFWITLSVLVVTCPCALSLATPVSITAAIYRLRQLGLLVTKSHVVEALDKITHVVFDKTGTLTTGSMSIKDIAVPDDGLESDIPQKKRDALLIAAKLEEGSSHPIAKVFKKYFQENIKDEKKSFDSLVVESRRSIIGSGIEAVIAGRRYRIGKKSFVEKISSSFDQMLEERKINNTLMKDVLNKGVVLGSESGLLAVFTVSDISRAEAKETIKQLEKRSLSVELLSGDNETAVAEIAYELSISHYQSEVSPEEKLAYLKSLQKAGSKVLMLGDGLNDLPILSGADVSIAMSSASDLAQVQADSVLLRDDLGIVPQALDCVGLCQKVIRQNLSWAVLYNVAALPLAAFGFIPPYAAAIGMSLSSLIVVLNATRIYRFKSSV